MAGRLSLLIGAEGTVFWSVRSETLEAVVFGRQLLDGRAIAERSRRNVWAIVPLVSILPQDWS